MSGPYTYRFDIVFFSVRLHGHVLLNDYDYMLMYWIIVTHAQLSKLDSINCSFEVLYHNLDQLIRVIYFSLTQNKLFFDIPVYLVWLH